MFRAEELEENPFVIAEVGQNHQGSLDIAREYIRIFASEGASAIKFQTRNNKYLFDREAYEMEYHSENAFAATYGAHREALELRPEWIETLKSDCRDNGVFFMSTPFDEPSLELLVENEVDILKVASFDLGNLPLVDAIARVGRPVVLSTGGGNTSQIDATMEVLRLHSIEVAVLHCVSEYPCSYDRLGLGQIEVLRKKFPDCAVGSSDHFNGTLSGPVAYLFGARVFEKHVTLNRSWKGTDHSFALERDGFRRFVRDIRRVRHMIPSKDSSDLGKEPVFQKLGKSVIARVDIKKGQTIKLSDLSGRIFRSTFIPVREANRVVSSVAIRDIPANSPIRFEDIREGN